MNEKLQLLINLPQTFHTHPLLKPLWDRLEAIAEISRSSADTPEQIEPHLEGKDAVLMWAWPEIDRAMQERHAQLQFIGFLNMQPQTAQAALERGLAVSEARHGWSPAVAEMALTLVLNGLRRISAYHVAFRQGSEKWVQEFPADIDVRERQLTGRNVGLVGFGGIGRRFAELLRPFETRLRIFDPYAPETDAAALGGELTDLLTLCRESEVIVLAAPTNEETDRMIGGEQLQAMQAETVLVNVCRASVIDAAALEQRLDQGDLLYLTDVFEQEPLPADDPLRQRENVWGTPHRAGAPSESVVRILTMLITDLEAWKAGEPRKFAMRRQWLRG